MTLRTFITILVLSASSSSLSAEALQNFVFLNAELSVQMALTAVQDCQCLNCCDEQRGPADCVCSQFNGFAHDL